MINVLNMEKVTPTAVFAYLGQSMFLAGLAVIAMFAAFVVAEPSTSHSASSSFTISQTITSEIAFLAAPSNVTMSPSIPGMTGGVATGTMTVRVFTNDSSGYNMTIVASGSPAMQGVSAGGNIPNYTPAAANFPDFSYAVAANTAEFGYTVSASTTADLATLFKDTGTVCNVNSGSGINDTNYWSSCWYALSTTATTTVNRTSYTPDSGATTTYIFKTTINSNPAPSVPEDFYMATSTLTAVTN